MKLRKSIVLLLFLFVLILVSGCESADSKVSEADSTDVVTKEEQVPINANDLPYEITIRDPDSGGYVYMDATYTNNSKYPITSYALKVLLKDTNETTYLGIYDTVMPGETSPKFNCFGPKTLNPNDYEVLALSIVSKKEDGETIYVDYDFKLNEASWY